MEIKIEQIFEALAQVAKQNFLSEDEAYAIIEEAIQKAFHSKYDPDADLELSIDKEKKVFQLINKTKLVVEDSEYNPDYRSLEVPLSIAKKKDAKIKVGDYFAEVIEFKDYAASLAQSIKQLFTQQVREKKKEVVYARHKSLKGEMIDTVVSTITNNYVILTLDDGTNAFMPNNLRNPKIPLKVGQKTKVFVEDVLQESKDAQIVVSNGSKEVVKRILEIEVPEVMQGSVEIVNISRVPGFRSKIAVKSTNENIDPIGAIIGERGQRINAIISKLEGEKIDVILWSADENIYVANALAPAKVISVLDRLKDDEVVKNSKIAITPNRHQTLAIGKKGQNVKLAVELTGIKIDVISEEEALKKSLPLVWNTGVTAEEVKAINEGVRFNKGKTFGYKKTKLSNASFESEIESFTNKMEEEDTKSNFDDFNIDENLFSDEALKDMEADFEYDEELANYENDFEDKKD